MRFILTVLLFSVTLTYTQAQRILLLETKNSAQTEKYFIGDYLQYRLTDDEQWYDGHLYELREDQQLIVFEDRFVTLEEVRTLKRRRSGPRTFAVMLGTFGLAWSGFAAIGTATDGNPDTNYRWSDAAVTGVSIGLGAMLQLLWGTQKRRVGPDQRRRLRIIDISF